MPNTSLSDFLEHEVYPRLIPEMIYTDPAHRWGNQQSTQKWRGGCPWHDSASGTSFVISLDTLLWWCEGCKIGGTPVQYLWKLHGGGGMIPWGRDFVAIVSPCSFRHNSYTKQVYAVRCMCQVGLKGAW